MRGVTIIDPECLSQVRYRCIGPTRGGRVVAVGHAAGAAKADAVHVWSLPHAGLAHLLAVEQPDVVVNAAGRASVPASMMEPLADFEGSYQ